MLSIDEMRNIIKLKCVNGNYYEMNFRIKHTFELGNMYVGNNSILYLIDNKYERKALNAISKLNNIKYDNIDMKKEFYKYLPQVKESFRTISGEIGIVIKKDEDLILLRDLLTYCKGRMSINEVSWILNSLYNIVCFINYNGLTHNGITVDNYFVSVKNHYGALLGGWWYAVERGKNILRVSKDISKRINYDINQDNKANSILDLESIKVIGRTFLDNNRSIVLSMDKNIHRNFMVWLEENSSDNPFHEYGKWRNISNKIQRENFIRFNIDKNDLYKSLGGN